ncbi:hypothetical protein GX50_01059 [[Emmonsia] crescens]|uniref:Uncharacterized protein n=1 Tax=[Emmonsia] crescens TaxID=73230 RepID=A0A2B7ZTF6_9EURO|nr:hypothetical protein GX50_01059 [Emmonsia crescens]
MGGVPCVPQDHTRPLKVIGAGYSRTGTLSMALALEKLLDGPIMHGGSQLLGREDGILCQTPEIFTARARHDRPRLLKLLHEATAGFVAITDAQGNYFVAELLELYPDAEVSRQEGQFGPMTKRRMDEHNEYVKELTPPSKFYMVELNEGWASLCRILKTPIPDELFPRANDAEAVEGLAGQILVEAGSRWAGIFASNKV